MKHWLDRLIDADRQRCGSTVINKLAAFCKIEQKRVAKVSDIDDAVRELIESVEPRLVAEVRRVTVSRSTVTIYAASSASRFVLTRLLTPRLGQLSELAKRNIGSVQVRLAR